MNEAMKNDYVQIKDVVVDVADRKPGLPEDTAKLPYLALIQGFLQNDTAKIGDMVKIKTPIGRILEGELHAINPSFGYDFGRRVPELLYIGPELQAILYRYDGGKLS